MHIVNLRSVTFKKNRKKESITHHCSSRNRVRLFATPWTVAHQVPLSMEFSRQEYWSGLPFPSPEGLANPGTELKSSVSPALARGFFTTEPPGKYSEDERVQLRSKQSILKDISPGCSLEGLILKLKLQYFGHLMRRVDSLEKTLMLGQEEKGTTEDEVAGWHH